MKYSNQEKQTLCNKITQIFFFSVFHLLSLITWEKQQNDRKIEMKIESALLARTFIVGVKDKQFRIKLVLKLFD
jgi:hypothetical protein